MWGIRISILGAILGTKALGVHALNGVVCNNRQARHSASIDKFEFAKELGNTIAKPIDDICTTGFKPEDKHRFISYESGPLVFTVTPTDDNAQLQEGCRTNFDQIIEECIVGKNLWGGSILTGGILYQIYNQEIFGTGFNDGYHKG